MVSLVEKIGWVEWLGHSNFSFLYGASHPQELLERAVTLNYRGLGIADFDGVYGLPKALQAWRKQQDRPHAFKLLYGAEIHLEEDHHLPVFWQNTVVLIARNRQGYSNLCQILTFSHRLGKNNAHISLEDLATHQRSDLLAFIPMRGKKYWQDDVVMEEHVRLLKDLFPHHLQLIISRHLSAGENRLIHTVYKLAQSAHLPIVFSQDVFMHHPSRKPLSDVLQAIRHNKTVGESTAFCFPNGERSLHGLADLHHLYHHLPMWKEGLYHSLDLMAGCHFSLDELRYHYPKEMIPPGYTPQEFLVEVVWQAVEKRYGTEVPSTLNKLLLHELQLIETLQFADYFLTVWDIVCWARQQGILCQGRGSAANSAVCYMLGITAISPENFEMLFERFISAERGDPPDIDVDFEHERREEVIQYIYRRFGRAQAAMVANVITFQRKGSLRAVGKALGIADEVLDKTATVLGSRYFRSATASSLRREIEDRLPESMRSLPWHLWFSLADELQGFPRHLGIHAGGFIIADHPLAQLVPQEPATMENRTVIQWCKDDMESLGFFKIDVLGLGILSVLRKTMEMLKSHYDEQVTLDSIPANDPATYKMIQKADTVGVFQIESRAQMSMLPRLKPKTFYDLVIEVAIIRPGPIQGQMIHPYLRRRQGLEAVTFPDPRLQPILTRTLGVPIFQEQVMRIAIMVGGFTAGEANELRRHMGAFKFVGDIAGWISKLKRGMLAEGIGEDFIQSLIRHLEGFSHYGFPESHAASFALLAYASSYFKCHYPAAYFTAMLNSQPMGFYSPHVLIQTAQHAGVKILPVCAQQSRWDAYLEELPQQKNVYGIRLGLHMVRGLSEKAAHRLVEVRGRVGGWQHALHFLQGARLSRRDLTCLAAADALAIFGVARRAALWLCEAAPWSEFLEVEEEPMIFAQETPRERLQQDFAATTTSLGPHPAIIMKEEAWAFAVDPNQLTTAQKLPACRAKEVIFVFGLVIVRQAPPTAKGMVFLTLEDETGTLNLALKPHVYQQYYRLVEQQAFICARGIVQRQGDGYSVLINLILSPQEKPLAQVLPLPTSVWEDSRAALEEPVFHQSSHNYH